MSCVRPRRLPLANRQERFIPCQEPGQGVERVERSLLAKAAVGSPAAVGNATRGVRIPSLSATYPSLLPTGLDPRLTASGSIASRMSSFDLVVGSGAGSFVGHPRHASRTLFLSSTESGRIVLPFDGPPALESA